MKVLGVIVEYNPFHKGHLLHLEKSKAKTGCPYVVAVMSGNFVQRGEPAIIDKYKRTEMALKSGIHIVIELPVYYSCASAQYFAKGAIETLEATGIVDCICFGTENGNIETIIKTANTLLYESPMFKKYLKKHLDSGVSYPVAREKALNANNNDNKSEILGLPNNILAVEYVNALIRANSSIKPYTIKREMAGYHSKEIIGDISSATAIRNAIFANDYDIIKNVIPDYCFEILKKDFEQCSDPHNINSLSKILHYIISSSTSKKLAQIEDISEGLENRIIKMASENFYIDRIISDIKCKRYTFTKIQRAIIHIILNITKKDMEFYSKVAGPQYIRVLGFRKEGEFLLKQIKENSTLPLIVNIKNFEKKLSYSGIKMLKKEIFASEIYNLSRNDNASIPKVSEFSRQIIKL